MSKKHLRRYVLLVVLTCPLWTTTCLNITQTSLVDGFFDGVTPHLLDAYAAALEERYDLASTEDGGDTARVRHVAQD